MQAANIALALKYRPKRFEDLIGQETVSQTLSLALDTKRLSHAYLFSGLRGSGKTSTARIFAKALLCERGETSQPCEICQSCQSANESRHIDIIELDAASNRKIDDIRALIEQTKYKPAISKYKIFIIDEVHMLTKEAFNALLKTLEEPPLYVKFILATTDPLKLPATILSRTQHFRFKKIATVDVVHHLISILHKEEIEFEQNALEILARSGNGSLRDTLTLLDQAILYSKGNIETSSITQMLGVMDPVQIAAIFNSVFAKDKEKIIEIIKQFEVYDSDVLIDDIITFLKQKLFTPTPPFNTFVLERFFRVVNETKQLLSLNADASFALTLMFFKMIEALEVESIVEQIKSLESSLDDLPVLVTTPEPIIESKPSESYEPTPKATQPIPTPPVTHNIPEIPKEEIQKERQNSQFETLINQIHDRDHELGTCFEKSVSFITFENETLEWMSCADESCKKMLKTHWSTIRHLTQEVFGINVAIKAKACDKELPKPTSHIETKSPQANENSSSMMEDIERGNDCSDLGSCMQSAAGMGDKADINSSASKEIDSNKILEEPFIKEALKLFEAKKVKILLKV
jgi:DNA polymerase III subunit gamma/tau